MESMKDVSCALGRVEKRATIDRTETRRGEGDLLPPFISPPSLPPSLNILPPSLNLLHFASNDDSLDEC